MIGLWLGIALMTAVALGFVLWPCWRKNSRVADVSPSDYSLALHQQQRTTMEASYQRGELSAAMHDQGQAEIARAVLADVIGSTQLLSDNRKPFLVG